MTSLKSVFDSAKPEIFTGKKRIKTKSLMLFLLLGGLLSFAIYLGLSASVNSLLRAENRDATQTLIGDYVRNLETKVESLDAVHAVLSFSDMKDLEKLRESFAKKETTQITNEFYYLGVFIPNKQGGLLKSLYDASISDGLNMNVQKDPNVYAAFLNDKMLDDGQAKVFIDQNVAQIEKPIQTQIHSRPLLLMKKIRLNNQTEALIVTVSDFASSSRRNWLSDNFMLSSMYVRNLTSNMQMFGFTKNPQDDAGQMHPKQYHEFTFGGVLFEITTQLYKNNVSYVLQAIPLLGLIISLIVTLLASAYAYVQQMQSSQVADMNKALEVKNKELQSEADKREKLNQDLKKSEHENRAVIDSISDIIFETDTKGALIYVNAAWPRITGFSVMQSKDKDLFSLLHPQDQDKERESFELLVRGQKSAYRTFSRLRTIDGTFRAIELSISMMRRTADGQMNVVGAITDVEERRRAERALGEAEKKYRAIVENAAWGIYQMTPEGIYLSANPSLVKILGYESSEDMLHKIRNAHDQVYGNERERKTFLREVDVKGMINNQEVQIFNRNEEPIWVSENIRAVKDESGSVLYYEGSLEDITNRKEADIMLREAKIHSDMANRAKSEFLTNMSHELRTPLNAIIGFSEIIKNEAFGPLGHESYREYINDIYGSGRNLLNIINEILEISRLEVRERDLSEEVVEIPAIMESCLSLLGNKIHANQIEILNMLENVPEVVAEERALKQVFTNILSNSVKFTPRGGRVTIRHDVTDAGDLQISITDTGIGLEPDEIKKALSPFGQVGSSTKLEKENAGTGLGLTLVKALVELHDGKIEIFSQKGMGTTVTVKLPVKRVQKLKPVEDTSSIVSNEQGGSLSDLI